MFTQLNDLNKKPLRNLNHDEATTYSLVIDAFARIKREYPESEDIYLEDEQKVYRLERFLSKKKRFEIYRGIILNSFYTFYYEGEEGTKKGRQYITSPIILRNEKHVILITLDPDLLEEFEEENLEKYTLEFEEMIKDTFEMVYNKDRRNSDV